MNLNELKKPHTFMGLFFMGIIFSFFLNFDTSFEKFIKK